MSVGSVSQNQPVQVPQQVEKKQPKTVIDKTLNAIHENTKEGTFVGDNKTISAVGSGIGLIAAGSGAVKLYNKFPAVKQAVDFTFVQNGKLVGGAASLALTAALAQDAAEAYKDGDTGKAIAETAGAAITGLGGVELVARQYNVPVLNKALTGTVEKTAQAINYIGKNHGGAIVGAGAMGGAAWLGKEALENFEEGNSALAFAEAGGAAIAGLGGAELIGRQYNIPGVKRALSGPAEFAAKNVKAVMGGAAAIGGGLAITSGVTDVKENFGLNKETAIGAGKILGGTAGVLGGAELIGRQYNIPVMKQALTGTVKAIFTSKAGLVGAGGIVSASGAGALYYGGDKLLTGKGVENDLIGAAALTAGVAGATGGASIIGFATGSEKLMRAFPESLQVMGGVALTGGGVAAGKYAVENFSEEGHNFKNTAAAAGAVALGLGGVEMIGSKLGIPGANAAFEKGAKPLAGAALIAASKLGAEFTAEDMAKNGTTLINAATGTASAAGAIGGLNLIANGVGIKGGQAIFNKGYETAAAVGLGIATWELGEMAVAKGKEAAQEADGWKAAAAAGLGAGALVTGATSMGLIGHAYNIPVLEQTSLRLANGVKTAAVETGTFAFNKLIKPTVETAVKHPGLTLGALAVAGGGLYAYHHFTKEDTAAPAEAPEQATQAVEEKE